MPTKKQTFKKHYFQDSWHRNPLNTWTLICPIAQKMFLALLFFGEKKVCKKEIDLKIIRENSVNIQCKAIMNFYVLSVFLLGGEKEQL